MWMMLLHLHANLHADDDDDDDDTRPVVAEQFKLVLYKDICSFVLLIKGNKNALV